MRPEPKLFLGSGLPGAEFSGRPYSAPMLIGLAGRAGVGKDTLATWLGHRYGHAVRAYADPLRQMLSQRFGWTIDQWNDRHWKENHEVGGFTPRQWLQWLGTDILREYAGYDILVQLAFRRWDRKPFPMVLSDIRFNNEAQGVINRGGFVIELQRGDAPKINAHVSESGVDPKYINAVLTNDGTISDLFEGARALIENEGARLGMQYELDLRGAQT